jgi:hypothetical protein
MNDELFDDVLAIKTSAKMARDDDRWNRAIRMLATAKGLLEDAIAAIAATEDTPRPAPSGRLYSELADVLGLTGGVQKRWGLSLQGEPRRVHLRASLAAYEDGFKYEKGLQHRYASTYNRINRLVGQVLLNPDILEANTTSFFLILEDLDEAEKILTTEIRSARQADPWAYCDLGTVRLLKGNWEGTIVIFRDLDRLHPPPFVYESALDTLTPLSEVAGQQRPVLSQAVDQLRRLAHFRR